MVLLTATEAAKAAIEEYCRLIKDAGGIDGQERLQRLSNVDIGSPVEHADLIEVSRYLVDAYRRQARDDQVRQWRLDALLKGATIYRRPPAPKPEPVRTHTLFFL